MRRRFEAPWILLPLFVLFAAIFLLPRTDTNAALGDGGYCWLQTADQVDFSDPRPHRYGGRGSTTATNITIDPGTSNTYTLYLYCNVYSGQYWGGMNAYTNPYTDAGFLSGVNSYGNDHGRCAMHSWGNGCNPGCCEVNEGGGYVSYDQDCDDQEWSTARVRAVTLNVSSFMGSNPSTDGQYKCKNVTIHSGGSTNFWCNGASGCGDKGTNTYNFDEAITQKICVKAPKYTVDVNPVIDGTTHNSGLSGFTFDVYLNGTLVADDVTDYYNSSVDAGATVRVVSNAKTNYDRSSSDQTKTINSNTTFSPTWTRQKYTVNFNSNGGSGSMSAQTINRGDSTALKANSFTRTYYYFNGWNTRADGKGTSYANQASVRDIASAGGSITLYAQWAYVQYDATFTGNITHASTDSWSGSGNTYTGTGLKRDYSLTVYYQLRRTNKSPDAAVTAQYAYSPTDTAVASNTSTAQPTSAAHTSSALSQSNTFSNVDWKTYTVSVPIGTSFAKCFYLSYDNNVKANYLGSVFTNGRTFGGKTNVCIDFSNPAKSYTAAFQAYTNVIMSGENLVVTDNKSGSTKTGQTGVLTNYRRNADGTYSALWPSNTKMTATFTHQINRSKNSSGNDAAAAPSWYTAKSSTTSSDWVVQEKTNGGSWANTSTKGTTSFNVSNTTAQTVATSVNTQTLSASTMGLYVTYCQRLRYANQTTYTTQGDGNGYKLSSPSYGYTTGNEMCAVFRNPKWDESTKETAEDSAPLTHQITVSASTAKPSVSNALEPSSNYFNLTELTSTISFPNSVQRADALRFDEGNLATPGNGGTFTRRFYPKKGTMYSNSNFIVSSAYLSRINYHTVGAANSYEYVSPQNSNTTVRINNTDYSAYSLNFDASNRTTHAITSHSNVSANDTWTSPAGDGDTVRVVGVDSTNKYNLLAGQTKVMCNAVYNAASSWTVPYVDIYRREYYNGNSYSNTKYDRTELALNRPNVAANSSALSSDVCVTLHRDYNFNITSLTVSNPIGGDLDVTPGGQDLQASFLLEVERFDKTKNFVTDLNSATVYSIGYVIPVGTDRSVVEEVTAGGTIPSGNTYCSSTITPRLGTSDCRTVQKDLSKLEGDKNRFGNNVYGKAACNRDDGYCYDLVIDSDVFHINDLDIGSKFCIQLAVTPLSNSNNTTFLSRASCISIGKMPNMQVLGSSIQSLSDIKGAFTLFGQSSGSNVSRRYYGSSVEFGIIANGAVSKMASGMMMVSGRDEANSVFCDISPLTFANSQCISAEDTSRVSTLGQVKTSMDSSFAYRLANRYHGSSTEIRTTEITADTFTDYGYTSGNSAIITYAEQPVIIYASSDITIKSNIIYSDNSYTDTKVPQVYIIAMQREGASAAPNIYIDEDVERIDAILVISGAGGTGTGTVDTCAYATDPSDNAKKRVVDPGTEVTDGDTMELSANICTKRLTINGGVIAGGIHLKRTYGADNLSNIREPAEVVNFLPSVYFAGVEAASQTNQPFTTYLRELAPRY